jgi:ubiquinone/menaquinone biosynthesis C-methylase UbiE
MRPTGEYSDLSAETYDLWFPDEVFEDAAFYGKMIREAGGSALEVACGTGRLLLPYLREGLDVEGVDSSSDMLEICLKKAQGMGLSPVVYQQRMQNLDVPRRYRTIYIPFASFMLVHDRAEAFEALQRFHTHLEAGGQVLISTSLSWGDTRFSPRGDIQAQQQRIWSLRHAGVRPEDGATILVHHAAHNDYTEQLHTGWYRYEVYIDRQLVKTQLQVLQLRWYSKHELILLLEKAGFHQIEVYGDYSDTEASDEHEVMVFRAKW